MRRCMARVGSRSHGYNKSTKRCSTGRAPRRQLHRGLDAIDARLSVESSLSGSLRPAIRRLAPTEEPLAKQIKPPHRNPLVDSIRMCTRLPNTTHGSCRTENQTTAECILGRRPGAKSHTPGHDYNMAAHSCFSDALKCHYTAQNARASGN